MPTPTPRIAAVILAAGLSRRMGRSKPLLPFGDEPLLARVAESLLAAGGIHPIVVVTGHQAEQVLPLLSKKSLRAVHNSAYASGGMLSSIQVGLASISNEADAVLIVLGDQPMVRPQTIAMMASAWARWHPRVILPTHASKHGHPVLLSAELIGEILSLPGDQTLKACTSRHVAETLELDVDDPAILQDLDTPDDYAVALERWRNEERNDSVRSAPCPSEAAAR